MRLKILIMKSIFTCVFFNLFLILSYCNLFAINTEGDHRDNCTPMTLSDEVSYTEDFSAYAAASENSMAGVLPDCWDRIFLGNPAYTGYAPHIVGGSSNAPNGTGDNCLYLYAGSSDYGPSSYAILPAFSNDPTTLEVDFAVGMNTFGSGQSLALGYITDITDYGSFVSLRPFDNIYTPDDGTTAYQVRLDTYTIPAGARLCFRWTTSWNACYIDDLTVRLIPSCVAPDALTHSHLTSAGVTLEWTPAGDETAWTLDYGSEGHTPGTGTLVSTSANPYLLTGLVSGETYDVYVRAACGATEFSEWTGPVTFRVPCPPAAITAGQPYTEDFSAYAAAAENSMAGVLPDCWDRIFLGNPAYTGYAPHIVGGSSNAPNGTGDNCLYLYAGSSDYGPSSYAILPAFSNDPTTLEVDFAVGMNTFGSGQSLALGYITDITDYGSFVSLRPFDNIYTPDDGTTAYQVRLDTYTIPAGARLCFRWTTSWNACYIDDLTVRLIYAAIDTTVCENSLPFVWNGVTFTEAGSQWGILTASDNTDSLVLMTLNTFATSYTTIDTTVCANALPFNWNGLTITSSGTQTTTLPNYLGCDSIVTLNVEVLTENVTEIIVETCDSFVWNNIAYSQSGVYVQSFPVPNACDSIVKLYLTIHPAPVITISGNTVITSGEYTTLTASGATNYQWSTGTTGPSITVNPTVTTQYTVTGTDSYGCYGTASVVVTVVTGISEIDEPAFVVYPNPASAFITIEYDCVGVIGTVSCTLFNSVGQVVRTFDLEGKITKHNIQGLAPGVYILYLRNRDSVIGTRKVIVH